MAGFIAACGLDCKACDAYIATQTNNAELARQTAEKWGKQHGDGTPFPIESTRCDGCLTASARKGGYCGACAVRACALAKKVDTCGHCSDYGCATLEGFLAMAPMLREPLERIRQEHLSSHKPA
jgi:hypothetical protein